MVEKMTIHYTALEINMAIRTHKKSILKWNMKRDMGFKTEGIT